MKAEVRTGVVVWGLGVPVLVLVAELVPGILGGGPSENDILILNYSDSDWNGRETMHGTVVSGRAPDPTTHSHYASNSRSASPLSASV